MSMVERSVEVHVPVTAAYNQWTQFEEFMETRGVETGSWRGHIPDPDERRSS